MAPRPRLRLLVALVFFAQFLGGGGGLVAGLLLIRFTGQAQAFFNLLVAGRLSLAGAVSVAMLAAGVAGGQAILLVVWVKKATEWRLTPRAAVIAAAVGAAASMVISAFMITNASAIVIETAGRALGFPLSITTVVLTTWLVSRWIRPVTTRIETPRIHDHAPEYSPTPG
jgi:hypothetical protein